MSYPCLCLCLRFSQITRKTPRRRITLHLLQMRFTEALTFIRTSSVKLLKSLKISAVFKGFKGMQAVTLTFENFEVQGFLDDFSMRLLTYKTFVNLP